MVNFLHYIFRGCMIAACMIAIYFCLMAPLWFKNLDDTQKILKIYTWANRIDESMLQRFEEQTGIKVYLNYYESVEELLTKLEVMPFVDCDLMLPSSYVIDRMVHAHLIKPIDLSRCTFVQNIYSEFWLTQKDRTQCYAIPLYWDIFGVAYNANTIKDRKVTLDLLFDKKSIIGSYIGMTDEPREAIFLASSYLGLRRNDLKLADFKQIRYLLRDQKAWVGAYSDSQQGYYLASDTFQVVASDRENICRQMLNHDFIKFAMIPTGSMLRVDNVVINANSKKDDLIYEFLNFLYSDQVMMHHAQTFCILPTTKIFEKIEHKFIGVPGLHPSALLTDQIVVFDLPLTQKEINDFWIRFKAS